jgi:hypothetical protein
MASFVKYYQFVTDLITGVHNLSGTTDTLKVALSNTAPTVATDAVLADVTEITAEHGYSAGGADTQNSGSASTGTYTVAGTDLTITASGGTIGPFRYAILYNDTPTSPADPLIGYWDYGSSITLQDGESFTVDFGSSMFTVS